MEKYKPEYLGKVIPADNPAKLTDFVTNKYDSFSKIYDTCKEHSAKISDVKLADDNDDSSSSLSVKVSADKEILDQISEKAKDDDSVDVTGDIVSAK